MWGRFTGLASYLWFSKEEVKKDSEEKKEEKEVKTTSTGHMNAFMSGSQDALGGFDDSLTTKIENLNKLHAALLKEKLVLSGFKETETEKHIKQERESEGKLTIAAQLVDFAKGIIKAAFSTPHQNIQREEDIFGPQIVQWSAGIKKTRDELTKAQTPEETRNKKLELCNEYLHFLEELIGMVNNVQRDMSVNEGEIKGFSVGAEAAIKSVLLLAGGIIYPSDVGVENLLRQEAYSTIEKDRETIEAQIEGAEDMLANDMNWLSDNSTRLSAKHKHDEENKAKITAQHRLLAKKFENRNKQPEVPNTEFKQTIRNSM